MVVRRPVILYCFAWKLILYLTLSLVIFDEIYRCDWLKEILPRSFVPNGDLPISLKFDHFENKAVLSNLRVYFTRPT